MIGPEAFARSLSHRSVVRQSDGTLWQYHSRSDNHSKKACWLVVLDVMLNCPLLRDHVEARKVYFGINHEMRDFQQNRKKDLDLVLCTSSSQSSDGQPTFAEMAEHYGIDLSAHEKRELDGLPALRRAPVGSVLVALEAKACMTEHGKARPRLYDELNSSHLTIHGATDEAVAAGLVVVNHADSFISPGKPSGQLNYHKQPSVTASVLQKILQLPRRAGVGQQGFDAIGALVVDCRNDGSPVDLVVDEPAPQPGDALHYESMIHRISHQYATRFSRL